MPLWQVISGLFAGVAGLSLVKQAAAEIEVRDDRDVRSRGFDLIYEARDVDLSQAQRDGLNQARHPMINLIAEPGSALPNLLI